MAYQTNYYISTTPPAGGWTDAQNIDAVLGVTPLTGSRPPLASWKYAGVVSRLDGQRVEVGYDSVLWTFDVLPKAQYLALRGLFTSPTMPVWIRTRNPDTYAFSDYTGLAHRPDADDKRRIGDKFLGVELLITHLEPFTGIDTIAPVITAFAIDDSDAPDIAITTMTATDAVGVTGYAITESNSTPALDSPLWEATAPTTYRATFGEKTLYAWAKDAAGNISDPATDTYSYPAPAVGAITGVNAALTYGGFGDPDTVTVTVNVSQNTTVTITGDEGISDGGVCNYPSTVFNFPGTFLADGNVTVTDTVNGTEGVTVQW